MNVAEKLLSNLLRKAVDDLEGGNCNMTEDEMIGVFGHIQSIQEQNSSMSKAEACKFLNMSRQKFDRLVADGVIPNGKKRLGFKELSWSKAELKKCIK